MIRNWNSPALRPLLLLPALLTASFFGLGGCSESPPPGVLEEPAYTRLLSEVFLLRSRVDYLEMREQEDSLLQVLLNRHEVTMEEFEESHRYYQRQPDAQADRIEFIREQMTQERDSIHVVRQQARESRNRE